MSNSDIIAITIGDINGIGIDILIKTWNDNKIKSFILFSDVLEFKKYLKKRKINIDLNIVNKNTKLKIKKNKFNIYSYQSKSPVDNTYKSLKYSYEFCKKLICIGIINLPLRKDLIKKYVNKKFIGQTEYYQAIDNKKYANMLLYHKKLIISPLTTHVRINKITNLISDKKFLYNQIYNINETLIKDFNYLKPKIIISGVNPHSGENGLIGKEEIKIITPIIIKLRNKGIDIDGPYSADSMLINKNLKKYNCFIFMYHDQALIPFKFISQFSGVNYTGNLDIIRTSPDHGTAYNLVGSKKVSNKSFLNCYKFIKKINKNRNINVKG